MHYRKNRLESGVREAEPQSTLESGLDVAHGMQCTTARGGAPRGVESRRRLLRVQMLSGTIAIVDGDVVLTNLGVVTHTLGRWVVAKNGGVWQIEGAQATPIA